MAEPGKRMQSHRGKQLGFTVLELMIGAVVLLILGTIITGSMGSLDDLTSSGGVQTKLQLEGTKALNSIINDLTQSGFEATLGYPAFINNGIATGAFAIHSHTPAQENAQPGDPDFGPDKEIIFLLPQKTNQTPNLDVNGFMIWDTNDFSYVVVTNPNGINTLERRLNGATQQIVARHVERILFEDNADWPAEIPVGTIRARIWFRDRDRDGRVYRHFVEATVRLPNKQDPFS